jgi:hypothetical protein
MPQANAKDSLRGRKLTDQITDIPCLGRDTRPGGNQDLVGLAHGAQIEPIILHHVARITTLLNQLY